VFARLLLWRDSNHNGISEAEELTPAAQGGVVSLEAVYKESRRQDAFGNQFLQRARAELFIDGNLRTHYVYDV
jgi:hypothetical protein